MITKGQLVEIPEHSPLYRRKKPLFPSKEEELRWESQVPHYSLFDGFLVGDHPGTEHYKLGQRKGINVGGKKAPLYVIAIDHTENRVFVGGGTDHPALWRKVLVFNPEQLEGMQGFKFTQGEMENGIRVAVEAHSLENPAIARLYVFGSEVFLEAENHFPLTLLDENLILREEQQIIAILKIKNIN